MTGLKPEGIPKRPPNGPKMAQNGSKTAPRRPKMTPRRPQNCPKMAQDRGRWTKIAEIFETARPKTKQDETRKKQRRGGPGIFGDSSERERRF